MSLANALNRGVEWLLWAAAGTCFVVLAWASGNAVEAGHAAKSVAAPLSSGPVSAADAGKVIGRMEIPALHLTVPITAGVETTSLLRGVGHMEGTALAGGLGTIVLAGHRDTYLRPLERVRVGMDIRVMEGGGVFHYTVDNWEIVLPEHVESLAIKAKPELALVTCYPFHYIGAAPKRFVVHAHLASVLSDAAGKTTGQ